MPGDMCPSATTVYSFDALSRGRRRLCVGNCKASRDSTWGCFSDRDIGPNACLIGARYGCTIPALSGWERLQANPLCVVRSTWWDGLHEREEATGGTKQGNGFQPQLRQIQNKGNMSHFLKRNPAPATSLLDENLLVAAALQENARLQAVPFLPARRVLDWLGSARWIETEWLQVIQMMTLRSDKAAGSSTLVQLPGEAQAGNAGCV